MFAVGGKRLAACAEEVESVMPWPDFMPVPSRTPYVNAVIRRDRAVLPVFDLAARLQVEALGNASLCLVAKHKDGPLAIRIDQDVPALHMVEPTAIRPHRDADSDILGAYVYEAEAIPVLSLAKLGTTRGEISLLAKSGR